ncbi:ABC transporter B family member 1-like [Juglans microcarpa x Juglans regia]|uniref:ABC transporter B family member 1-like n=1 Tax=Juglans microcarpa x Juglans regia TaxID=2249226 RepID=UPI001B7EAEB4|nr:ABC transporter B family member 1-like [Juglans microcarpa x Juglans regia]
MNKIAAARVLYHSEATFIVEQTISQIKTVYAFVGERCSIKSFSECMEKQFLLSKGEALIKGVGTGMFQTVSFCSWALIIWVGAILVTANRAKGGDIIAAVMSILFGAISMTYAAPDMQIFNQAKAAGNEVFQVIHRKPIISFNSQGKMLERVDGNIDICDVYFAYPSRWEKLILQGFSLSIPAGKTVALVGSSGCGKSTIISLVSRFYDPSKGEIFIDKHNIKDLDLKFLRRNVGVVSQEPSLFAGTIKDNMKVGNIHADDQQIQNAVTMANAHSFISQLPNKYLTEVGQRGVQLSGGQKQRIAIARAILKDPPIIFLDEATSALDSDCGEWTSYRYRNTPRLARYNKFYNNLYNTQNLNPVHDSSVSNTIEEAANIQHQISSQYIGQKKEHSVPSKYLGDSLEQEDQRGRTSTSLFFRIWFGLKKIELAKIVIGSFAAAFSGISKPVFGFCIIAIGVAYYEKDAKREVGWYSIFFSLVGLLSLFSHTLQHYFFGMVGEKAKRNLTQALYSGTLFPS